MTGWAGEFLVWLATTTVAGTLLAAAIGGLKVLLGPRMPLGLHHGVWLILVVRLLLPGLPEVPLGLPSFGFPAALEAPAVARPASAGELPAPLLPSPSGTRTVAVADWAIDPTGWLWGLWALGFFGTLGRRIGADWRLRRRWSRTSQRPPEWVEEVYRACRADLGVRAKPPVVVTAAVQSPALVGWPRSHILFPQHLLGSLSPGELNHVLGHELAHAARHDILWGWITGVLRCLHWFNPLLGAAFRQMDRDAEIACDAAVLARSEAPGRRAYGETLVRLSALVSRAATGPLGTAGWAAPHRALARRLGLIVSPPPGSRWSRGLSLGLVFLVALGGLTAAQAPRPVPSAGSSQSSGLVISIEDRRKPGTKYLLSPVEYMKTSLYGLVSGGGRFLTVNGRPLGPGVLDTLPGTGPWVLTAVGPSEDLLESLLLVHEGPESDAGLKVTRTATSQVPHPGEAQEPGGLLSLFAPFKDQGGPSPFVGAEMTVQDLNAEKPRWGEAPTLWFSGLDGAQGAVPLPIAVPAFVPPGYRLVPKIPVNHRKDGSWIVQLSYTPSGKWEANGITIFESNQLYLDDSSLRRVPVKVNGAQGRLWAFMGSWSTPGQPGMTAYLAHQLSWSHGGHLYAVVDGTAQTKAVLQAIAASVP